MVKLKSKLVHIKKLLGGNPQNCEWFTFKEGQEVPDNLIDLVKQQGGELEQENRSPPPFLLVEETSKFSEFSEFSERLKEVKEDLEDDGKLNFSNNPFKRSPGRPRKVQ